MTSELITANGTIEYPGLAPAGMTGIRFAGTWGGALITIREKHDNGETVLVSGQFSEGVSESQVLFLFHRPLQVVVSGATPTTSLRFIIDN